jgi:integrase
MLHHCIPPLCATFWCQKRAKNFSDRLDGALPSRRGILGRQISVVRHPGGHSRVKIGRYPIVALSDARKKALTLKADLTHVPGPNIALGEAVQLFLTTHCRNYRPSSRREAERLLRKISTLDKKKVSAVSTHDVQNIIDGIKAPSEATHLFKMARTFFRFCFRRRFIENSPLAGLTVPNKERARARVLSDAEVKSIWLACSQVDESPVQYELKLPRAFAAIVKLLLLTAQRRGEIAALRTEFLCQSPQDETTSITLPASLTKNGREHHFPVGPLAASVLKSVRRTEPTAFLFPVRGGSGTSFNGWSKSKQILDRVSGVSDWTLHDIRRTVATRMAELGVPPHVIERILNHVTGTLSPISLVYNRATFMKEMREAVNMWEARLAAIIG